MGLAVLERARKRQASRINYLREGDANTKFFRLRVNARRRKNLIQRLKKNDGWVTSHAEKEQHIHNHFSLVLGVAAPRPLDLNWEVLDPVIEDLEDLGLPFSEDEISHAISDMPADKAPGPDGFTINFIRACWPIIKFDIMNVIDAFSELSINNMSVINTANIALLPKKDGADFISDFRRTFVQ
jgi:hypothetical protein